MSATLAIARKEARDILRERTILVALVVQLFVAGLSTFLTVGLTGLYDSASITQFPPAQVAYTGEPTDPAYRALAAAPNLELVRMPAEAASASFDRGDVAAAVDSVLLPDGTWRVTLLVPHGGIRATLLLTQFKAMLSAEQLELRQGASARLATPMLQVPLEGDRPALPFAFAYATLLPLLVLTPIFLAGATAGDSMMHEVQTRTLTLLRASPAGTASILAGKLVAPVLLAPAQVALWLALLAANRIPVRHPIVVLLVAFLAGMVLACAGAALALGVRKTGQVQAGYALVAILLAVGSLFLPRTPMNLLALAGAGSMDGAAWTTLAWLAVAAATAGAAALPWCARRIRTDPR